MSDVSSAYLLRRFPLSEGRYIVDLLTREEGRLRFSTRGVRCECMDLCSVLRSFQRLRIQYIPGQGELWRLTSVVWEPPLLPLAPDILLCAYYLNELLLRLTPIGDGHAQSLFDLYETALYHLVRVCTAEASVVLRRFERDFLKEVGYAIFFMDTFNREPIDPDAYYTFDFSNGFMRVSELQNPSLMILGESILNIQEDRFDVLQTRKDMKSLFAYIIHTALQGKILKTKKVLNDVAQICTTTL